MTVPTRSLLGPFRRTSAGEASVPSFWPSNSSFLKSCSALGRRAVDTPWSLGGLSRAAGGSLLCPTHSWGTIPWVLGGRERGAGGEPDADPGLGLLASQGRQKRALALRLSQSLGSPPALSPSPEHGLHGFCRVALRSRGAPPARGAARGSRAQAPHSAFAQRPCSPSPPVSTCRPPDLQAALRSSSLSQACAPHRVPWKVRRARPGQEHGCPAAPQGWRQEAGSHTPSTEGSGAWRAEAA